MSYAAYRTDGTFTAAHMGTGDASAQMPGFVGQAWSKRLFTKLAEKSKFVSQCGRDYEGEIKGVGDSVRIFEVNPLNAKAYTILNDGSNSRDDLPAVLDAGGVVYETLGGNSLVVQVTQADYEAIQIEDIEEFFANPKYFNAGVNAMADALALSADLWILTQMITATAASANEMGRAGAGTATLIDEAAQDTPANIDVYGGMVDAQVKLDDELAPDAGRFIYVPTFVEGYLRKDPRFVAYGQDAGNAIKKGGSPIGSIAGFDVYTLSRKTLQYWTGEYAGPEGLAINANLLNKNDALFVAAGTTTHDVYNTIAGVKGAFQFVDAITKNETLRLQNAFANGVRSLHVYGGKALRPNHLLKIATSDSVTTAAES